MSDSRLSVLSEKIIRLLIFEERFEHILEEIPGEKHTYSSGCLLSSPFGAMRGNFNMINFTTTKNFKVVVPSFRLNAPFALN